MWKAQKFKQQEFIELIKFFIKMYQPDSYLEVGLQKGFTFNQIAPLVKKAVGLDIKLLITSLFRHATVLQMDSSEYVKSNLIGNTTFDLILIDADHKKESVLKDVDNLLPFLTPQTGLMLLHDTYPGMEHLEREGYCYNAWEAAREIHSSSKYKHVEILTLPGPYAGLSVLRRAEKHLHWKTEEEKFIPQVKTPKMTFSKVKRQKGGSSDETFD